MDYDRYEDHYWEWAHDQYESELIDSAMREASEDSIRRYLCTYGDAVEERVSGLIDQAKTLTMQGFCGPGLSLAVTASELIIRFLLLRPLVQGAFLDDQWAEILTARVVRGRSADHRELLPSVLRGWGIDVTSIRLNGGAMLWQTLRGVVWKKRNAFIHVGEPVHETDAKIAIGCSEALLQVAHQVGNKLGCGPAATGRWSEVRKVSERSSWSTSFEPHSPFE